MRRIDADPSIVAIDNVGRICLPGGTRAEVLPHLNDSRLFITLDELDRLLAFFSRAAINEFAKSRAANLGLIETDFRDLFHLRSVVAKLDKRGRFTIPEQLRAKSRLGSSALVTCFGNYLTIDDPARVTIRIEEMASRALRARESKDVS